MWIALFFEDTLFEYKVSTILPPIVDNKFQVAAINNCLGPGSVVGEKQKSGVKQSEASRSVNRGGGKDAQGYIDKNTRRIF